MGVSKNRGGPPKSSILYNRVFHCKPSVLGYPYFWKHPYNTHITNLGHFDMLRGISLLSTFGINYLPFSMMSDINSHPCSGETKPTSDI